MGRAYGVLGNISTTSFAWQEGQDFFTKAIELDPNNATSWQWYGLHLAEMGRKDEGIAALESALKADPVSRIIINNYAETLRGAGRTAEAVQTFQHGVSLDPEFDFNHYGLALTHLEVGSFAPARTAMAEYARLSGESPDLLTSWIDRVENYAISGEIVALPADIPNSLTLIRREWALFFVLSGHTDAALDLLEEAADQGYSDAGLYQVLFDFGFRSIWHHPRFIAPRVRIGLPVTVAE